MNAKLLPLMLIALLAVPAMGDELVVNGLPYGNVTVLDLRGVTLVFRAGAPERTELCDKSVDPHEQRNITGEQPEVTETLKERAVGYLKSPPPPWGEDTPSVEIDEMQMNQLRALGYGVQ